MVGPATEVRGDAINQSGVGSLEFNSTGSPDKADYERINGNADLLSTLSAISIELGYPRKSGACSM